MRRGQWSVVSGRWWLATLAPVVLGCGTAEGNRPASDVADVDVDANLNVDVNVDVDVDDPGALDAMPDTAEADAAPDAGTETDTAPPKSPWSPVGLETDVDVRGVVALGPDSFYAVGAGGLALRFDGKSWVRLPSGVTADLNAITGQAAPALFAVVDDGTALAFDGNAWHLDPTGTKADLHGVTRTADGFVFAVGQGGVILRRDLAGTWALEASNTPNDLYAATSLPSGEVYAAGQAATVLRRLGDKWVTF